MACPAHYSVAEVIMEVRFWGVRGSIASPGPTTANVGGNTSSVEVRCGDVRILLDAGTGLRSLGDAWLGENEPIEATLLLSHFHWDHIQGLPFFVPAYFASTRLSMRGPRGGGSGVRASLDRQMSAPHFPVTLGDLRAALDWHDLAGGDAFTIDDVRVRVAALNHPGGVLAYRIEHEGAAVVYATDTEHRDAIDENLVALAEGADLLVYDAQYTPAEFASKVGWGHSTFAAGVEIARAAGVAQLALFHHDPKRDDAAVGAIEAAARELFATAFAAREGLVVRLGGSERRAAA